MRPKKKTKDLILRGIPEEIHRAFKTICAAEGKTMTEKIVEYMKQAARDAETFR